MLEKTKISNLNQLGEDLLKVYGELRDGSLDVKTADALANVAGKVIGATKVILEYHALDNQVQEIELIDKKQSKRLEAGYINSPVHVEP